MKKHIIFLFLTLNLFAQEIPISESNSFIYNKYTFGSDCFNVTTKLFIDSSGKLTCHPYSSSYYTIKNTQIDIQNFEKNNVYPIFLDIIYWNNLKYYATTKGFYVLKDNQLIKKIILSSNQESCSNFFLFKNAIYYIKGKVNIKDRLVSLYVYDGKKSTFLRSYSCDNEGTFSYTIIKKHLYFWVYDKPKLEVFRLENNKLNLEFKYDIKENLDGNFYFKDGLNFKGIFGLNAIPKNIVFYKNGKVEKTITINKLSPKINFYRQDVNNYFSKNNDYKTIFIYKNDSIKEKASVTHNYDIFNTIFSKESNSYYCSNGGNLLRLFPHIKKYPRLFNNTNSSAVFSLFQTQNGAIWAGGYNGNISIIDKNKVIELPIHNYKILNGSMAIGNKALLFGESHLGNLLFSDYKTYKKVLGDAIFFYGFKSSDGTYYFGSAEEGLWNVGEKYFKTFDKKEIKIITKKEGLENFNILSICEDKNNAIWVGSGKGLGIYFPKTNRAVTWLNSCFKNGFTGSMALLKDYRNTLWLGSKMGKLFYYDDKNKKEYNPNNLISIDHPLFNSEKAISFIHQWNNFLILGAGDKVLLFDLKKWYENKTVSVRYLNPMELNLTSDTEQNTILTDKRDESIWFSSSDMVYQWDIKKWLTLPTFKVTPTVLIKKDSIETEFASNKNIEFKPSENSFDIQINSQTKDNMPRFVNGVLAKKGEKPVFENPNLQTKFQFKNLSTGDYVFYIRVCQQDGSYSVFQYPINVDSFLWQKWWFWLLLSLIFLGIIVYFFQERNQIEKQKKKLSQLNLSSLSNQFRPHFMLNALNSIGSQMEDKPHAEKVISRLGESINILYGFTQKNEFTISFINEWKLVENSIEIQKLLFIPGLDYVLKNVNLIPVDYKIPVGLLQIPVENALLHGLRNKTDGNCILEIDFDENEKYFFITISDNGVGREMSSKINNFKKNGNGLKTISEMLTIINQNHKKAIFFEIIDKVEPSGTIVKIALSKNIDYDKIKF